MGHAHPKRMGVTLVTCALLVLPAPPAVAGTAQEDGTVRSGSAQGSLTDDSRSAPEDAEAEPAPAPGARQATLPAGARAALRAAREAISGAQRLPAAPPETNTGAEPGAAPLDPDTSPGRHPEPPFENARERPGALAPGPRDDLPATLPDDLPLTSPRLPEAPENPAAPDGRTGPDGACPDHPGTPPPRADKDEQPGKQPPRTPDKDTDKGVRGGEQHEKGSGGREKADGQAGRPHGHPEASEPPSDPPSTGARQPGSRPSDQAIGKHNLYESDVPRGDEAADGTPVPGSRVAAQPSGQVLPVLPLGAGMTLIGLGLAFLALRLRRG